MLQIANGLGEVVPEELNNKAMSFFALSKAELAHIHLNSLFESENIRVSISPAVSNHLWNGSFLWSNYVSPSGVASVLTFESYLKSDTMQEAMALDCAT